MDQPQITIEAAVAAVGSKVTYAGSTGSVIAWLSSSEAGFLTGIIVAVVGLIVNVWFKAREDKRQQQEHEQRMLMIKNGGLHE